MTAITNECPYCRNADTLGAVYYDQNCVCCVKRMTAPPLCMCKDRPLAECPGEWEPGCDLGNNPKFVKAYVPRTPQPAGQEDMAAYAAIAANYKAAPTEPEPVAWITPGGDLHPHNEEGFRFSDWVPLYYATPPRAALTDFQRMQIIGDEFPPPLVDPLVIAKVDAVCRAIEAAHNIGGPRNE